MATIITDLGAVTLPAWVNSLEAFRCWTDQNDFPEKGCAWWLCGEVWIDMSKEQIFAHVLVKTEFTAVVGGLVKSERRGLFLTDGLLLSNFAADVSGNPDGTFFRTETLRSDHVRLLEAVRGGFTVIQGSPDLVLEVVSDGSVHKDLKVLRKAYWEADIREYWMVDARKDPVQFDILSHSARGYVAVRKQDGWLKSALFGKAFQLRKIKNALGYPEFYLNVR